MELQTYNGEHFERSKARYALFFLVVAVFTVWPVLYSEYSSLYHNTTSAMIGAVIILIIAGGYFFFLTKTNETIHLKIEDRWLQVGKKSYARNTLSGFVLEYHMQKQAIHNIVLLTTTRSYEIFTIEDTDEHLQSFATQLEKYLPLLDKYEQGFRERFSRKIKL